MVPQLTDLPTEILVTILGLCSGQDVLHTSEAHYHHPRLASVVCSPCLWVAPTLGPGPLRPYLKYLGAHTTRATLLGPVKLNKKGHPTKHSWEASEHLSPSVLESLRLRCPSLSHLSLRSCVLDVTRVKLSLFPRSLTHLVLDGVALVNLPLGPRQAASSSPFLGIKKLLPLLQTLTLAHPDGYLRPGDLEALVQGCRHRPTLSIEGESHIYDFSEQGESLTRGGRRSATRQFRLLMEHHHTKKSYNTRALPPQ